jgi:hypothetical protein
MSERIERERDRELSERRFYRDAHGKSRPGGFVGTGWASLRAAFLLGIFLWWRKEKYLARQGETWFDYCLRLILADFSVIGRSD